MLGKPILSERTPAATLQKPPASIPPGAWAVPPVAVIAIVFLYPLALIARQALIGEQSIVRQEGGVSFDHIVRVVASGGFRNALLNTVQIAVGATIGCLALGLVLALILSFVAFPGSRIVERLIETFVALPTFLVALAFTFIYGSAGILNESLIGLFGLDSPPVDFLYSQWGVILAEVTVYTPFVLRPLLAAFSLIDMSQIEVAGSLGARPARVVRQVILPAAVPALLAGGSLCLLLTVNEFGVVLFIGAKGVITLPLLVYDKAIQEFDYTTACVIALVNVALSMGLYTLYRTLVVRFGGRRAGLV